MVSVGEGDGMVQVCATLSAVEDTETNSTITLATKDRSGGFRIIMVLTCIT